MSTMFADTLLIVFISVCTALLAEGECWAAVQRAVASLPQQADGACPGWALVDRRALWAGGPSGLGQPGGNWEEAAASRLSRAAPEHWERAA